MQGVKGNKECRYERGQGLVLAGWPKGGFFLLIQDRDLFLSAWRMGSIGWVLNPWGEGFTGQERSDRLLLLKNIKTMARFHIFCLKLVKLI